MQGIIAGHSHGPTRSDLGHEILVYATGLTYGSLSRSLGAVCVPSYKSGSSQVRLSEQSTTTCLLTNVEHPVSHVEAVWSDSA